MPWFEMMWVLLIYLTMAGLGTGLMRGLRKDAPDGRAGDWAPEVVFILGLTALLFAWVVMRP